jgi:hypothetical protein
MMILEATEVRDHLVTISTGFHPSERRASLPTCEGTEVPRGHSGTSSESWNDRAILGRREAVHLDSCGK